MCKSDEFKKHTLAQHGNAEAENSRGQVAVTEDILANIDRVLDTPTFAVAGVKRKIKYADAVVANSTVHSVQITDGGSKLPPTLQHE